jgi:hypothetical protein
VIENAPPEGRRRDKVFRARRRTFAGQESAGYRRIEIASVKGAKGEYRCQVCGYLLEIFDGTFEVLIRLTVPPVRAH